MSFSQEFQNPTGSAKPFIRWWIWPGFMTEEQTRHEVQQMTEAGFARLELVSIAPSADFGSEDWNRPMKWAMDEAAQTGIVLDVTIGFLWPVTTPAVTDPDDDRAEQALFYKAVDFTSLEGNMVYSESGGLPIPDEPFDLQRSYELIAVTAAKKTDSDGGALGTYDHATAVNLTSDGSAVIDDENGMIEWLVPSVGEWTIFYFYRQSTNHYPENSNFPCVDHFSLNATRAVTGYWNQMMDNDAELKELYENNGGSIFCDSLELGKKELSMAAFWTKELLSEFKARRGYDLTPYLPTIFIDSFYPCFAHLNSIDSKPDFEFSGVGYYIRLDFLKTLTELFIEHHLSEIKNWANTHNMTLRYQGVYGAPMEITSSAAIPDITETESWGMRNVIDGYRLQSGVVHMLDNDIYSTESAALIGLAWRQTWTGSHTEGINGYPDGEDILEDGTSLDLGLLCYLNRQFVAGVNLAVLHGFSYKSYLMGEWPGDSFMSIGAFSNEWGDKTPMWEHAGQMVDYLARTQLFLQQGSGKIDLALYRLYYYDTPKVFELRQNRLEAAGYSYDFVSPYILNMEQAYITKTNGQAVLAAEGPSYKALILDQRKNQETNTLQASDMPLETAEKILGYAKEGLPIIIIDEAPSRIDSYPGSLETLQQTEWRLAEIMEELRGLNNVLTVQSRDEAVTALKTLDVYPEAYPDMEGTNLYYHRTSDLAEYYYIYNSSLTVSCTQTVTFKGEGRPYIVDAWTGDIIPIALYTQNNDGITFTISLKPNDNILVAIAQDGWDDNNPVQYVTSTDADSVIYNANGNLAIKTTTGGEYSAVLNNDELIKVSVQQAEPAFQLEPWTMQMESWTEGDSASETKKTLLDPVELNELVPWSQIDGLRNVAGIATYKTTFTMEQGWEDAQGAELSFSRVSDTMRLIINEIEIKPNQLGKQADIGVCLKAGLNTVVIEVASNLSNIKTDYIQEYGLIGDVTVTPYRITNITGGILTVESGTNYVVSGREAYDEVIIEEGGTISADAAAGYSAVTLTVDGVETSIVSGRTYSGVAVLTPVRSLRSANSAWSAFRTAIYIDDDGINGDYTVMDAVIDGDVSDSAATNPVMRSDTDLSSWQESFNGVLVNVGTQQNSPQGVTLSDYSNGTVSFDYVISNPDIAYTGPGGNDFIGLGAAVMASGNSRVLLRGNLAESDIAAAAALVKADPGVELTDTYVTSINNRGQVRTTLVAEESAVAVVDGAYTKASDGEWIEGYIGSVSPNEMKSVPWMLGLYGNVRSNNLLDNATGLYVNSILESENWGVLSTDESDSVQVEADNCVIRGTGVSAYGVYSIGTADISVTNSYMFIPTYAVISANGANVTEFKNTEIYSDRAGAMYHSGSGTIVFTDSNVQIVRELVLMRANASTAFNLLVDNSGVSFTGTGDNILVQLMDNDDVLDPGTMLTTVNFTDPAFAHGNNDNSIETATAYFNSLSPVTTGQTHTATFNNVNLTGDIYNSSVEYGADLTVLLSGTSLEGVVSSSVGLHEKETLVSVWDSNGLTGSEDYQLLGKLTNYVFSSIGNDVSMSLENGSTWIVTGTSYLTSLTVDVTSSIVAPDGYKVTLSVDGAPRSLTDGKFCTGNIVLALTKE